MNQFKKSFALLFAIICISTAQPARALTMFETGAIAGVVGISAFQVYWTYSNSRAKDKKPDAYHVVVQITCGLGAIVGVAAALNKYYFNRPVDLRGCCIAACALRLVSTPLMIGIVECYKKLNSGYWPQ